MIFVGVLTDLKRAMLLIQATEFIARLKSNVRFAIVGYGPLERDLKAYVHTKGLSENVVFLGKQIVDAKLLCCAKIFVMASSSEGLPCALMEAMACELLCVSTDVGNIGDVIIDGKTGFIFHDTKPQKMGEILLSLLKDYPQLCFVRKAAREQIENHHSFTSATAKWDKLLSEISQ
jgi:glycosyltransferase involved in cell wall biosynthesis